MSAYIALVSIALFTLNKESLVASIKSEWEKVH